MVFLFNCSVLFTVIIHVFTLISLLHVDHSSVLPSISLFISFFSLHSPPTLSLTKCCGASAAGCLPICYITVPSASLNYCWARLASAMLHILLSYHDRLLSNKVSVCVGSESISIFNFPWQTVHFWPLLSITNQ